MVGRQQCRQPSILLEYGRHFHRFKGEEIRLSRNFPRKLTGVSFTLLAMLARAVIDFGAPK
jgi:hypothetical protein